MKKLILVILTCLFSLKGFSQIYYSGNISFEHQPIEGLIIASDSSNQWLIGQPGKTVFTNALDSNRAMVTDTANQYVPGVKSVFVLDMVKYLTHDTFPQGWQDVYFRHSMDVDSLAGGYIEITFDSINWYNIFDQQLITDSFSNGFVCSAGLAPDTLNNGVLGFAHNFNNEFFGFNFGWLAVKSQQGLYDYMNHRPFIRFTFISDSLSAPNDGWMIDGISLQAHIPSSVAENLTKSITLFPNPAIDKLAIDVDEKTFKPTTYSITNVTGQELAKGNFTERFIDVWTFPQGSFFITLTDTKGNSGVKMFYKQ